MDNNELAMIQNNLKMLKQPTGQLKTAYNHNSGLIRLLKTINTLMFHQGQSGIAKGHMALPLSACGLYRACGKRFIMKYSIQTTKRLINLLCVAGAIKVLSWGDLPQTEKKQAKYKHIYYQCLDLREADFSRVSGMDYNTALSYASVATCYGKELADNSFSNIKTKATRKSFDGLGLESFINKVKEQGIVTYQDAANLLKETQHDFKYGVKWFRESLKALFIMGYFDGRLELTTYAKTGGKGLSVTASTKVITAA
ncbi:MULTISPECIES: hypothetical protein [Lactobacillaceae]|uniref:hypothetical protein n=1 Tax=Lactobacillaceae TaxID=33958 RepID=UPI00128E11B7|nr:MULTISPECIES: hypothetical protein [Lactobacillaceae]MCT3234142.1 hypothetical protein [Lactiplantibacillus plantarum]MQC05575.1 hypothetical protein [Limosilactobacillus reuteri]